MEDLEQIPSILTAYTSEESLSTAEISCALQSREQ